MANATRLRVGRTVSYRSADGRWRPARVIAVTSQTAVRLAMPRHTSDAFYASTPLTAAAGVAGQMTQLNSNLDVNRQTSHAQTNVWRP